MDTLIAVYPALIQAFADLFGASHATMHVHVGLALYLGGQLVTRERRASMAAINLVFAAEVLNEGMERLYYGEWRWGDTLADIALTMMWPIAITLVSQYRRRRWLREAQPAASLAASDHLVMRHEGPPLV